MLTLSAGANACFDARRSAVGCRDPRSMSRRHSSALPKSAPTVAWHSSTLRESLEHWSKALECLQKSSEHDPKALESLLLACADRKGALECPKFHRDHASEGTRAPRLPYVTIYFGHSSARL